MYSPSEYKRNSFFIKLFFLIGFLLIIFSVLFSKVEDAVNKSKDERMKDLFKQFSTEVHISHVVPQKNFYGNPTNITILKKKSNIGGSRSIFYESEILNQISINVKNDVFVAIGKNGESWGMVTKLNSEVDQYWCIDSTSIQKKTTKNQNHWNEKEKVECL